MTTLYSRLGGEFLVNTITANHQENPAITGLANGGFVVSWASYDQDGNHYGVYARIFSEDGTSIPALVSIAANDASAAEPSDDGQFTVSLTNPADTDTVIAYSVGGDASAGSDYTALTGTVTILAGATSAVIDVSVIDDDFVGGDETVEVTLTSISSGDADISIDAANAMATVTIADNDTAGISVVKTTADAFGNEGDGLGVLPGADLTWKYLVTNTGSVALSNVVVTDDQAGVSPVFDHEVSGNGDAIFDAGEEWVFTAIGTAIDDGWYSNLGTAQGDYTDESGATQMASDSDASSYFALDAGFLTDGSLSGFGDAFSLTFTPDLKNWPGSYKLSSSQPGQFTYSVVYDASALSETLQLEIPFPFQTQGANPISIYSGVFVSENADGSLSYTPTSQLASEGITFSVSDYTDTNGDGVVGIGDVFTVDLSSAALPSDGFVMVSMHLEYGLRGTKNWPRSSDDALNDPDVEDSWDGVNLLNGNYYEFNSTIADSSDGASALHIFKNIKGFGGLVLVEESGEAIEGAVIELIDSKGQLVETMVTDENGWYLSDFVHDVSPSFPPAGIGAEPRCCA